MLLQNSADTGYPSHEHTQRSWVTQTLHSPSSYHLRISLERSFATLLFHSGNADWAAAMAADVSFPFMLATVATTSPVAGFCTCRQSCIA